MLGYSPKMRNSNSDPLAKAMWDFYKGEERAVLEVTTDVSLPEDMLASYFFRGYDEMNEMERLALDRCQGRVLDIGAGAGCHSLYLLKKGIEVTSLETSGPMSELLKERGLEKVIHSRWQDFVPDLRYDHILLLMNGLGMAERFKDLPSMLIELSSWLSEGGEVLLDSSDIGDLYVLEDGSRMTDLGGSHEGEIIYTVTYKGESVSFPWLFVTKDELTAICEDMGLEVTILSEMEDSFLASVKGL